MPPIKTTRDALIDVVGQLAAQPVFDADTTIEVLDRLTKEELDMQSLGAAKHARMMAVSAVLDPSDMNLATARFALARVLLLVRR